MPPEAPSAATIYQTFCTNSPWLCQRPEAAVAASNLSSEGICHLIVSQSANPVTRLYGIHDMRSAPNGNMSLDFQELFYEWKATFAVDRSTPQFTVKINHLTKDDVLSVEPPVGKLSAPLPEWFSGFPENARTKPDYYSRTITFTNLVKGDKPTISMRRALDSPEVSPVNIVRVEDARTPECSAVLSKLDDVKVAKETTAQLTALASFPYGQADGSSKPLPLRRDPGDVRENEIEATVEARCQNPTCTKAIMGHLEVHMGKPLNQYFKRN